MPHDNERMLQPGMIVGILGGSAGGYTTLCALTFHDDFTVGASLWRWEI